MQLSTLVLTAGLTLALLVLAAVAAPLAADPIQDGSMNPYRAGWYSNASREGLLTCAQTCKVKASAIAEHEASAERGIRRTFVCKVAGEREGDLQTWSYGNQFDDRPACYTVGLSLQGSYSEKFFCLCVKPLRSEG